jgi:dTDP-4-amino-4,6-dideoxygalactose transaminase
MFESHKNNKIAYGIFERGINLPSYNDINEEEVEKVVNTLKYFLKNI